MSWLAGPPETTRQIEQLRRAGVPEHELSSIPSGPLPELWECNAKVIGIVSAMPLRYFPKGGIEGFDWLHLERLSREFRVKRSERQALPALLRQCETWMLEDLETRAPRQAGGAVH